MDISDITDAIRDGRTHLSFHAGKRLEQRGLPELNVQYSALHGEVIEYYPSASPHPACLVFGLTPNGEPLHSVWGYDEDERAAILVTAYRPDPSRWIRWRVRIRLGDSHDST